MTGGELRRWEILNPRRLVELLAPEPEDVRRVVKAAIDELLDDPQNPISGIPVYPLRGRASRPEPGLMVAKLPMGFTLTFTLHPHGMPPLGGRYLTIYALVREIHGEGPAPGDYLSPP